jgi:predicted nucleotide-binding protein
MRFRKGLRALDCNLPVTCVGLGEEFAGLPRDSFTKQDFGIVLATPDETRIRRIVDDDIVSETMCQDLTLAMGKLECILPADRRLILRQSDVELPKGLDQNTVMTFDQDVTEVLSKVVRRLRQAGFALGTGRLESTQQVHS